MHVPYALHTRHGGPLDLTGAPPWHPAFEGFLARIVRKQASMTPAERQWWEIPGVVDWLAGRWSANEIQAVLTVKHGGVIHEVAAFYAMSPTTIRELSRRMAYATRNDFLAGRYE